METEHEHSEPEGFWKDMPWWVKAIAIVGVPSIISIGVVYSDRTQLLSSLESQSVVLETIRNESRTHIDRDLEINNRILEATTETNRILLAGCVNDATTAEQRERCIGR